MPLYQASVHDRILAGLAWDARNTIWSVNLPEDGIALIGKPHCRLKVVEGPFRLGNGEEVTKLAGSDGRLCTRTRLVRMVGPSGEHLTVYIFAKSTIDERGILQWTNEHRRFVVDTLTEFSGGSELATWARIIQGDRKGIALSGNAGICSPGC